MFSTQLKTVYEYLTNSEKAIADYIMNDIEACSGLTSNELAQKTETCQSTIIRFSQKLGYNSYRSLLMDLSSELAQKERIREDIKVDESMAVTNQKIAMQYQDISEITLASNSEKELTEVCHRLIEAHHVIIFGMGSSNLFAEYLANQLIKLGIQCTISSTSHTIYSHIDQGTEKTVVILISESGETSEVIKAAKIAKEKKCFVIGITKNSKNSLYNYSNLILKTVSFEDRNKLNVTTMRCSQLLLIDIIYLNILKSDYNRYCEYIERAEELAN